MNRRSFFRSLGIATAALYLRIAPDAAATVPRGVINPDWEDGEYDVVFLHFNGSFERGVPEVWTPDGIRDYDPRIDGLPVAGFTVKNGILTWDKP